MKNINWGDTAQYGGYVYTLCAIATMSGLSLTLDVRNTTVIIKYPVCILLALLQISQACVFSFRLVRYGSCVPFKKKKKHTWIGRFVRSQCFINNALWCCTNSKRGSGSLDGPQCLVSHRYTVFNSVIEKLKYLFQFLSFVQPGLLCIETWNLWNEVEK